MRCCVSATKAVPATHDPATATTSAQPENLRFNRKNFGSADEASVQPENLRFNRNNFGYSGKPSVAGSYMAGTAFVALTQLPRYFAKRGCAAFFEDGRRITPGLGRTQ